MSNQGVFGGPGLAILVVALGLLGILVDLLFFVAFVVVVGYAIYRMEKRVGALEGTAGAPGQPPK